MSSSTILLIILAAVVAFMLAFFQYFYKSTSKKTNTIIFLAFLRWLAVFSLLLLLINPKIKSLQLINMLPTLNVVVDNSLSIQRIKQDSSIRKLVSNLKNNTSINKKFNIKYYAFGNDLQQQDSFKFDDPETNITKALTTLSTLNRDKVAPILLISDGNQTYGSSYEFYKSNQPLYPVIVGDTLHYDDLKINQINVNSYTSLNNKFPVEIFLQYEGEKSIKKMLSVMRRGKVVFKKVVEFSKSKNSGQILFYLPATEIGIENYTCEIGSLENEKNSLNNKQNFSIEVIDENAKVLILSAINHPDISMIKRSIESNKQHKVTVEKNLGKEIQYKDYQLVILYQPTNKFNKVFNKINNNSNNLFIITGKQTDWNFLNKAQSDFSKKSIKANEKYSAVFNNNYDEFITEDIGFSDFPPIEDHYGDITVTLPFKIILNQHIAGFDTKNPLLMTFTNTDRREAVLFGENVWKWRMQSYVENRSYKKFDIFFNRLIQYLSSDKRSNRLELDYKPFVYNNSSAIINAQLFDANYRFDSSAKLSIKLTNKSNDEIKNIPFSLKNNKFEVILDDLAPGDYSFTVNAENHSISKNGKFTVLEYNIEQQFVSANTKGLKKLANDSDGNIFYLNATNKLLSSLLIDKRYVSTQKSIEKIVSLIEWKWLLSFIILFLSLEWFIRKYKGLI